MAEHPYIGRWASIDGLIRQELRADGRFEEARGAGAAAVAGTYTVEGNAIALVADDGDCRNGSFDGDVLHREDAWLYRDA